MTPTSSRAYRLWLRLLPSTFRHEFADEMTAVYIDQRSRARGLGVLGLWIESIVSIVALSGRLRLDQLRLDLRDAGRALLRNRTFALTTITTLALALGPATAVFSVINGVVLDPIPGVNADRLIYVWAARPEQNYRQFPWSELNFADFRERQRSFTALAAYVGTSATVGGDMPRQVIGAWVSVDMFDALAVSPAKGRRFEPSDHAVGAAPVVILTEPFARQQFGDREAVGQVMRFDGRETTVVGVLPSQLRFPSSANFWQPLIINPKTSSRAQTFLAMMGRLRPGVSEQDALQSMKQIAQDLNNEYPTVNKSTVEFISARDQQTQSVGRVVQVLGLAALAILILACTNIASLLVVRTAGRHMELSVRAALGASAARLRRQLLVEQGLLAIVAAGVGIGVAAGLLKVLALTRLLSSSQIDRASLGWPAMAFMIGLVMLSATSIGWVVSRRASRSTIPTTRGESSSREVVRLRHLLVGVEVGAAAVLLAAATLLLQSAARLLAVDHGFQAENVVKFQVGLPAPRYAEPANRVQFIDAVVERLQQLPGVRSVAAAGFAPMTDLRSTRRFAVDGKRPAPGTEPLVIDVPAGPTYAETLGLRLTDGRWISTTDRADSVPVVVISESFARRYFPGERAIGHRVDFYAGRPDAPPPPSHEIVGVVGDVRQFNVAEAEGPTIYVPLPQRTWAFTTFFVRTFGDPRGVMGSLPEAVRAVDPERAVEQVQTLSELVSNSTADRRALSALLAAAALVALLISTIGVYGVTAASTAARRRELAIRAAIGADRTRLLNLVLRQGLVSATIGICAGILTAVGASSILDATLYEVQSRDPKTFALVAVALFTVCGIASYLPARRAVSASPAEALRAE